MNETTGNEMEMLTQRTERLISALTDAILSTAEVAAERIELASKVAQVRQRMNAFGAVLESVGVQKLALTERLEKATGATKALLTAQIEMLTAQETAVLEKAGVAPAVAKAALTVVDEAPTYRREGRAFRRAELATNGVS